MRRFIGLPRRASPSIGLQILALLTICLLAAQVVTLTLTLLVPPEPPRTHSLPEIAQALRSKKEDTQSDLVRTREKTPPSFLSPGWVSSEPASRELARLLGARGRDVRLLFYSPPPFAGVRQAGASHRADQKADVARSPISLRLASLAIPMGQGAPPGASVLPPARVAPQAVTLPGRAIAVPPIVSTPPQILAPQATGAVAAAGSGRGAIPVPVSVVPSVVIGSVRPIVPMTSFTPLQGPALIVLEQPPKSPVLTQVEALDIVGPVALQSHSRWAAPRTAPIPKLVATSEPPPESAATLARPREEEPARLLSAPPRQGIFGLARASYIEGDFVAAWRGGDGYWTTVRPRPEAFPNAWQRRVLLWFGLAFVLVAPLGLLLAHRLAAPLERFARTAERLGRDPKFEAPPLSGPAEVGRAARAFNLMQLRLRRYIDDRVRLVGAISHDLRTPLARMRFKVEKLPADEREALTRDIHQMEQMIESVLDFMRDEATTGGRVRVDLRSLLECIADEAQGQVTLALGTSVEIEADILGIRRAIENLVSNAVKYGGRADIRLVVRGEDAFVEIEDDGPGLTDEELERVFKPFYRDPLARKSGQAGVGLGLPVSRSIIRAHGGELTLRRGLHGLIAEVQLPLAGGLSVRRSFEDEPAWLSPATVS